MNLGMQNKQWPSMSVRKQTNDLESQLDKLKEELDKN